MSQETPPIVLFTYPESVVGRRMEWYLTLRNIPYYSCRVDSKMPRPVLDRIGVHYRRIPVLAVGRDIYCDSRCMIEHLERLYTETSRLGSKDGYGRGIERVLETWAFDGGLFMRTAQIITPDASLVQIPAWLEDRSELIGTRFDASGLEAVRPDALAHTRLHLQIIEKDFLSDGRKWLIGGEEPGLADVHVLWIFDWMLRPADRMGMKHAYPWLLNQHNYPKTFAWVDRMEAAFQDARAKNGAPKEISDDEAVELIEKSKFWEPDRLPIDHDDPSGLRRGDKTDLIALDSAPATGLSRRDVGPLEGLTVRTATVGATTKNGTDVRIHYQRNNVRVVKAGDQPRLTASEIPKS